MPNCPAEWPCALEVVASSADSCTTLLRLAHGVTSALIAGLVDCGLVSATTERMRAGQRSVYVMRLRITDTGRQPWSDDHLERSLSAAERALTQGACSANQSQPMSRGSAATNEASMSDSSEAKIQRWERYIDESRRELKLLSPEGQKAMQKVIDSYENLIATERGKDKRD
jgi:predicted lipid-binding transport protein (Tim44 family)